MFKITERTPIRVGGANGYTETHVQQVHPYVFHTRAMAEKKADQLWNDCYFSDGTCSIEWSGIGPITNPYPIFADQLAEDIPW